MKIETLVPSRAPRALLALAASLVAVGCGPRAGVESDPFTCANGADDDYDGLTDCADPGCTAACGPGTDAATGTDAGGPGSDGGGPACGDLLCSGGENCASCPADCGACPLSCGDGTLDAGEDCDGPLLGGATCASLGYDGGVLACTAGCTFDTGGCRICGDGVVEGPEACDGGDLDGASCTALGWDGGSLGCTGLCTFDESGCTLAGPVGPNRDVNGDGYDDLVAGAPYEASYVGNAYVHLGGPGAGDGSPDGTLAGTWSSGLFGYAARVVGDLNGDGYADVAVGAENAGASSAGMVYVYYGGPGATFNTVADGTITGTAAQFLGATLAPGGDLNGDGYDDLVVGSASSVAFVYFGGAAFDATADGTFAGASAGGLGIGVAGGRDLDADGYDDVVIGEPFWDSTYTDQGRAFVYRGGPGAAFDTLEDLTINGPAVAMYAQFGQAMDLGDLDGDGYADLAVAAPVDLGAGYSEGRVYVYRGGATLNASVDATFTGPPSSYAGFGLGLSANGDLDGDGYDDLAVGAPFEDAFSSDDGVTRVYLGGPFIDVAADASYYGFETDGWMGYSVRHAGDLDGDGYGDLASGAFSGGASDTGSVSLFRGGLVLDTAADLTLYGSWMGGAFGYGL